MDGFLLENPKCVRDNAVAMAQEFPASRGHRLKQETGMFLRTNGIGIAAGLAVLIAAGTAQAAGGDAENGKKLFFSTAQCKTCHSVKKDEKRVGPSLFGVVGRKCGTAAKQMFSSNYKAACAKTSFVWDEASLDSYLEDPSAHISKISGQTKRSPMSRKTAKAQDRADIIAYLATLK
jgi:cytochrome c